jgi:hypothetical protein
MTKKSFLNLLENAFKGISIRLKGDVLADALQVRREWKNIFQALK